MKRPLLSVKNFSFTLASNKAVFSEVSFDLFAGDIVALLGVNGIGKTTLLKSLGGVQVDGHLKGSIWYQDKDFSQCASAQKAKRIVYLGADLQTEFPLMAYDVVQLGRRASRVSFLGDLNDEDRAVIECAMKTAECWELRKRGFSSLSGGERQLVLFARGLAQGSDILLCDESFSRLDINKQSRFGGLIRQLSKEKTFIFVSHDANFSLEWADRFLILHEGKLAETEASRISEVFDARTLGVEANPFSGRPHLFFKESPEAVQIRKKQ